MGGGIHPVNRRAVGRKAPTKAGPTLSSPTSTPARKAQSTTRLYPALRTSRERVTFLLQPGKTAERGVS
ncbi:unnamed protein product [Ectocarpus sp. CCAP 1310/34]|nr:unnamed protein product [Ectocarpus sp. CCAP 1310/34]